MIWRIWSRDPAKRQAKRSKRQTERELREAAAGPEAKRDRQPRNHEQAQRDPEIDPAKATDN